MNVDRIALYNFTTPHKLEALLNSVTPEALLFLDLPEYSGDPTATKLLPDRLKRSYAVIRQLEHEKKRADLSGRVRLKKENLQNLAQSLFDADVEEWLGEDFEQGVFQIYRGGVLGKSRPFA